MTLLSAQLFLLLFRLISFIQTYGCILFVCLILREFPTTIQHSKTSVCFDVDFSTTMEGNYDEKHQTIAEFIANVNSAYLTDAEKYGSNRHVQNALNTLFAVYLLLFLEALKKAGTEIKSRFSYHLLLQHA